MVDELRARMRDELDYRLEAANQREFATHFAGHPFITIPAVDTATSTTRVLTTEWAEGIGFAEFLATSTTAAKQRAGESIWRFAQHAIFKMRAFNGDPHPGNYRFSIDGQVTRLKSSARFIRNRSSIGRCIVKPRAAIPWGIIDTL